MSTRGSYDQIFKDEYIKSAVEALEITNPEHITKIKQMVENRFMSTNMTIYNSVNHTYKSVPSTKFWYEGPKSLILNEEGTLFWKTSIKRSTSSAILINDIDLRQVYKAEKNEAAAIGDNLAKDGYERSEMLTKLLINGYYGLSGYIGGAFYNLDCSATCTCGGRNIIAVASLTNELLGKGFRHYQLPAHMKIINIVKHSDCDKICSKYTLPLVDTEEILKLMLLDHYDGYYQLTVLRNVVDSLSDNQKRVLYLKNNITEFLKVPEVKEVMTRILTNCLEDNMIEDVEIRGKITKAINPYKNKKIKDDIKLLGEMVVELSYGFYFYEGDWLDGVYRPTMVDIIENIQRNKIGGMDTDSNITTFLKDKLDILEIYKDVIGDKKDDEVFTEVTLVMIAMTMYVYSIQHAFATYARSIGVDESLIPRIDLECEMVILQDHLTISKKNYIMKTAVKDFNYKPGALSMRGLKVKKSDSNIAAAEAAEYDIENYIMKDIKELDYKSFMNKVYSHTNQMQDDMKSSKFITDRKTVVKVQNLEDISWGDSRMKAIRLWDRMFPEMPIDVPGSLGIIRLSITEEIQEMLEEKYPEEWFQISSHAEELLEYQMMNKIGRVTEIIMGLTDDDEVEEEDEDLEEDEEEDIYGYNNKKEDFKTIASKGVLLDMIKDQNETVKSTLRKIMKLAHGRWDKKKYDKELVNSAKEILDGLSEIDLKSVKKVFKIPMKVNMTKFITKQLNRIAVPVDINSVPGFISRNDYEIMDIEAVTEYQHLLSPLVLGMSVSTPKNRTGQGVITNILRTF